MDKVLIAYASKYGSTAEIAAEIGRTLEESGLSVEVRTVGSVHDLSAYRAAIIGSAVYAGSWMSDAVHLLENHEETLKGIPVWLFSSGPTGEGDPRDLLGGWLFPEAIQPVADRIAPRDITLFAGKIDMERLNWGERLIIRAMKGNTGDYRNWDAIKVWATSIAQTLHSTAP